MGQTLLVTGTDTGVGKTVVTAWLASVTPFSWRVGLVKPVQTGADPLVDGDEAFYRAALHDSGVSFTTLASLPEPLAPQIAAERGKVRLSYSGLVASCRDIASRHDLTLVEGSGGLLVPIASGKDYTDMAIDLAAPLVVVLRPALGTLNHTLLTVEAARARGVEVALLVCSGVHARAQVVEQENLRFLRRALPDLPLVALPRLRQDRLHDVKALRPAFVGGPLSPLLKQLSLGQGQR